MSIQMDNPMSDETQSAFKSMFADKIAAMDERTVLLDKMDEINSKMMKQIANAEKQPVIVETNSIGDTKMVAGTVYELRATGWRKIEHNGI